MTLSYVRSWAESIIDSITLKLGTLLVSVHSYFLSSSMRTKDDLRGGDADSHCMKTPLASSRTSLPCAAHGLIVALNPPPPRISGKGSS